MAEAVLENEKLEGLPQCGFPVKPLPTGLFTGMFLEGAGTSNVGHRYAGCSNHGRLLPRMCGGPIHRRNTKICASSSAKLWPIRMGTMTVTFTSVPFGPIGIYCFALGVGDVQSTSLGA